MYLRYGRHWFGALLLTLLCSGPATAAETAVTPSLELRQEYTDNLFYSPTNQLDTFVTRGNFGVKAMARTELLSGSLAARLSALHYSANSGMDDLEQVYEGAGTCNISPRLKISGSAAYRQESWPDREIEISGQALNLTSWRQNYGAGAQYQISELTTGSLDYGNEQVTYSNHTRFSSVISHNVSAAVEHNADRLLPLLKLRGAAHYSRSEYETSQIDNYELTVGAGRQLHELWSVSADAGGRYTSSIFQIPGLGHESADSTGLVLKASLDYRGEMLQGSLAYSRDLNSSSGRFGTAVERDAVNLSLRRRFGYELYALLGGGYYHSMAGKNRSGSQEIDDTSLRGSFSLRYEFNRNVTADIGYDIYRLENSSGSTAYRNKVFFQLTAQTNFLQ